MEIKLREKKTGVSVDAEIFLSSKKDMPSKDEGWNFNWKQLYRQGKGFECYKVVLKNTPDKIEALALFSITDYGLFYINQVEASPSNHSSSGKYEAVGALIAFACKLSLNIKEPYCGYLGFISKSKLIKLYQSKYKAKLIGQQLMCIEPPAGLELIHYYLGV